ncbi:MAG TPA: hypothetical protein VER79_04940 [Candidatus Limnocylindrales bacterium]|nr:hypothetical protein [Candidatus Limnocylindrales bacterium]
MILMGYEGQFTWEEAFRAQDEINQMLEGNTFPCALILNFPQDALKLTSALTNARTMMARRHSRLKKIVLVSQAPITRALGNTFSQFMGREGRVFEVSASLDDAERRLQQAGYLQLKVPVDE